MSLASQLRAGDVLLLRGELGAGKSVFARGIARGLGVEGPITSPTFTLLNVHDGSITLNHMDLYRLEDEDEFEAAGLTDAVGGNAIALIEWPDRAVGMMPPCHLAVTIAYTQTEGWREVDIAPMGGFREVAL